MEDEIRKTPPDDSGGATSVLDRASRRVLRRLFRATGNDDEHPPDENLLHDAESFHAAVEWVLGGHDPEDVVEGLPSTALPLVSLVRWEVLNDPDGPEAAKLDTVRAIERVDHAWRFGASDDGEADLRSWLGRPDAFDLLVELAHDLRSPLTSIIFLSETLRKGGEENLTDVQDRQLGLIYIAALGLNSVVSDVVELARNERDLVDPREAREFWIGDVFEEVENLVRPMAEEKELELRTALEDDERLQGHPSALSRILMNLAANAIKFTREGHVEIGMRRVGPIEVEFYVEDTGRGIPERQLSELFVPFRNRARDDSRYFSSSGLGLSICQRYLRAMGSELEVETEIDRGTRFFFRLSTSTRR